ncbi:glycosyltransferase family 4 protein [Rhodoferax sp. 4810]|uniref:Glycosyltransferase family 4 protein n=1 Tax=Thiospirillum jenense TaxID=1653858 RepID=A0A839HF48_9GAMM|nr:glycosyltransferase family 1 protein [Thiospirillum jenense]MBB1073982.1 glycosyltransferase family 4 protein [Rhodoferax jenense]MBB1125858.1 glycosyltransferase family 4 protein [Thiospirillum jenense]
MRIAYDHQAFCRRPYTGISRYYTRLFAQLPLTGDDHAQLFAPLHVNALLAAMDDDLPVNKSITAHWYRRHPRLMRPFIRHISGQLARRAIAQWRPDVVHETYYSHQSSAPPGVPIVLTVFDLIHERYPHLFPWYDRVLIAKRHAIARATHIICISDVTRRDLLTYYPRNPDDVTVIHLGVDPAPPRSIPFSQLPPQLLKHISRPFFLFVGERGGYKNFAEFIRAFAASHPLKHDLQIICGGGGAFSPDEQRQLQQLGVAKFVKQFNGDDALLHMLYAHATALIYPSWYEGFGLPLLEAMQHGCPVIASNAAALPEVAGAAAWLISPHDTEAWTAALETVAQSEAVRTQLRTAGFARVAEFSWDCCAAATLKQYRQLHRHCINQ